MFNPVLKQSQILELCAFLFVMEVLITVAVSGSSERDTSALHIHSFIRTWLWEKICCLYVIQMRTSGCHLL